MCPSTEGVNGRIVIPNLRTKKLFATKSVPLKCFAQRRTSSQWVGGMKTKGWYNPPLRPSLSAEAVTQWSPQHFLSLQLTRYEYLFDFILLFTCVLVAFIYIHVIKWAVSNVKAKRSLYILPPVYKPRCTGYLVSCKLLSLFIVIIVCNNIVQKCHD